MPILAWTIYHWVPKYESKRGIERMGKGIWARALGKDTGQWHWGKALGQELWEGFGLPILKSPCPYLF